jgi:uncharacterized protein
MDQSKTLSEVVQQIRQLLPVIAQQYQVKSIGVFGSYVKKQQRKESDLDLLVTFYDPPSLFKYIELENFLSDQLEIKVDLVMQDALKPSIRERVLEEVQIL